jgi:hypothetical protein
VNRNQRIKCLGINNDIYPVLRMVGRLSCLLVCFFAVAKMLMKIYSCHTSKDVPRMWQECDILDGPVLLDMSFLLF